MGQNTAVLITASLIIVILNISGCGGGGSSDGNGASSTVGVAKQGTWTGKYSSIDRQNTPTSKYSDLILNGSSIDKMYVVGSPKPQSISLYKHPSFTGNVYQTSDSYAGMYFDSSGNHMGMIYGADNIAVYQHESISKVVAKQEDINGVWSGSFFSKNDRDGTIHQYKTKLTCSYQICTFDTIPLSIDFIKPSYSDFYSEGTWYGRETNSGPRYLTTALVSNDLQFMVMSTCWSSFPIGSEGFFDICEAAVLSKTATLINNIADAGTSKSYSMFTTVSLDGSKSKSESGALTYKWRIISLPDKSTATLSATNIMAPTFVTDRPGQYVFGLVVNDAGTDSTESTVTIISEANMLPPPQFALTGTGAVNTVILSWSDLYKGSTESIEIYRAPVNDLGVRVLIATVPVSDKTYTDTPPYENPFTQQYYYWIRGVSYVGFYGPFNATLGVQAKPLNAP